MQLIVAPLVGAWIEISCRLNYMTYGGVAPLVGAWIEIREEVEKYALEKCRSSRGSVD